MTDRLDEWCHETRLELQKLQAQGATEATLTWRDKIPNLYAIIDSIQNYQCTDDLLCFACAERVERERFKETLKNLPLGRNVDWRRDAKKRK